MSALHTPGPWQLKFGEGNQYTFQIKDADGRAVASWDDYEIRTKAQARADADLITAAPELLAALQQAEEAINQSISGIRHVGYMDWIDLLGVMRKAIIKATGSAS